MRVLFILLLTTVITTLQAQVVINEICPANADIIYDTDYYNFSGWIELHNKGTASVNIGGYYLSDDISTPTKWRIPSGTSIPASGFILFWCDEGNSNRHTNFSLDSEGEDVVLATSAGVFVDKVTFPRQYTNISYGRISSSEFGYMSTPTPNVKNNTETSEERLSNPVFSIPGGRYTSARQITITHDQKDAIIRYTVDGSEPTVFSSKYAQPIPVSQTRTVKAKAFLTGYLPSNTQTHSYFINEHSSSLPIISLSANPKYFYDNTIGIYVEGTNGKPGPCNQTPMNWNRDWDRHVVFEYFDKEGNQVVNQSVDVRIGGNCSRDQPQKSLVLKARDKYGSNIIRYPFFEGKSVTDFGGFMLRNSGNDFNVTMFRDSFMQKLPTDEMDIDYMEYQPVIVYLNGQYMGIQDLREKIDADYIESNYNIDKDDLDLLETYENALEGSSLAYVNYRNSLESMDRSTSEAFDFIDQHIDVQEYINYLVTEIYIGNTDWPGNNMKFWRQRSTDGKFRWILWDTDFGFELYPWNSTSTHPTLSFVTATDGPGWPNPPWATLHIRLVLENPIFRSRFIQTMNSALNTTFHPDRVIEVINQFQERIAAEVPHHKQRWWGTINDWNYEVQRLRDFAVARNTFMRQHMADFFGLNSTINLSASITSGNGRIKINEVTSEMPIISQPYFQGISYMVEPVPALGYVFKEWKIKKQESSPVDMIDLSSEWRYYDQGIAESEWYTQNFDDQTWEQGYTQAGYGEGDEQTVVDFGGDSENKHITTYFRKVFTLNDIAGLAPATASVLFDDGVVVYCNGVEVYRGNMPQGSITHQTLATPDASSETTIQAFTIPANLFQTGDNTIAVEVHQASAQSSDLSFDFSLTDVTLGNSTEETSVIPLQTGTAYTDIYFEASFEASGTILTGLKINEVNAVPGNTLDNEGEAEDWIEIYNAGDEPINLTGLYITDNLTQKAKHQIQSGVGSEMLLAPGQHKIFWADEDTNQGSDHLSFKLSAEGEAIGLYQVLNGAVNTLDEMFFYPQNDKGSFSRLPDGNGPFVFVPVPSPGVTNQLTTEIQEELTFSVYPNPVHSTVTIESDQLIAALQLVDSWGRLIKTFSNTTGESISMHDNIPGLYFLRVEIAGTVKTIKIVKH